MNQATDCANTPIEDSTRVARLWHMIQLRSNEPIFAHSRVIRDAFAWKWLVYS